MNNELEWRQVLIVEDRFSENSGSLSGATDRLIAALEDRNIGVRLADSPADAVPLAENCMDTDAFLVAVDMSRKDRENAVHSLLEHIRRRQGDVPVFLLADREQTARRISPELMELADEFVWVFEDSPEFIAGRVEGAVRRFREQLLPPLMKAVWKYNEENHEYSWAAPGHQGGVGFTKSPEGRKFFDFYGENLFRTDTGIERSTIGSLLDHEGAFKESEQLAAKTFGADRSYSVVVGTSGSNRTIMQACLSEGDIAICDRNCHKSIEEGLILTGAVPVYLVPTRNRYGIIGPCRRSEMSAASIAAKIKASPLKHSADLRSYSVVTNCTYDGLCCNAAKAEADLARSADRIHFDEAWYGYARFHPVYADYFAMRGDPAEHRGATVFATHSTHKLLNALSQASYIHVRNGIRTVDFDRFNQAYSIHATTSPLYAICASNDIAAAMMARCGGSLIQEVIGEAVDFRQAMARLCREFSKKGSWFFQPWNAPVVRNCRTGETFEFADAPRELLIRDPLCWRLNKGELWHGFSGMEDDWVMLDPVKVSILASGMGDDGNLLSRGVPAALVSAFLYQKGIVPTRTTDFQLMFLFSMGITRGKWGTLVSCLLNFKSFYDRNASVAEVLPGLAADYPEVYGSLGIHELADRMFDYIRKERPGEMLNAAFASLPEQICTPRAAYMKIVKDEVEFVPTDRLRGRVTANAVIPYPPGIPLLISGENFGAAASPQIKYLQTLEKWDRQFPGFEHVTEGTKVIDGRYNVMCLK